MTYASSEDLSRIKAEILAVVRRLEGTLDSNNCSSRAERRHSDALNTLCGIAAAIGTGEAFSELRTEIDADPVTPIVLERGHTGRLDGSFDDFGEDPCIIAESNCDDGKYLLLGIIPAVMWLSRAHVAALLPCLHTFVSTGKLGPRKEVADA